MFSSWDLLRPRFWYPMLSLEQSMMELEQMNDAMMRPRFSFGMHRGALPALNYVEDGSDSDDDDDDDDDDDFFVDLPVVVHKCKPTALQLENVLEDERSMDVISGTNAKSNTNSSADMEVDDEGSDKQQSPPQDKSKSPAQNEFKPNGKNKKSSKHNKKLRKHSYKVTPSSETMTAPSTDADCPTYTSYSFSNSSVVDDEGRRVTTTCRRYEDSTGRLKAVHEREIDGKTLRTAWSRQTKEDLGRHASICSSGSPEEFETMWQLTPFGEAQKKKVKGQLQAESPKKTESELE